MQKDRDIETSDKTEEIDWSKFPPEIIKEVEVIMGYKQKPQEKPEPEATRSAVDMPIVSHPRSQEQHARKPLIKKEKNLTTAREIMDKICGGPLIKRDGFLGH